MSRLIRLVVAGVLLLPASLAAQAGGNYRVTERARVGGDGGWDYLTVDTTRHRLFVTRSSHVMVLDMRTDSVIADLGDTPGVHGVALAPDLGRAFTSNGRDSSVTIIDLATLKPIGVVHGTGANPDAILYEPATHRLFTFNGRSEDATVIDAASGRIVGTVPLGGKPETGNHDGHGRVLVNIETKNEVVAFDAATLQVQAHWPLAGCDEPTGQAIDRAHERIFVGCGGGSVIAAVNTRNGHVVQLIPAGQGMDGNGFDPATGLVFGANGQDGTMTIAHEDTPDHYTVVATVPTQRGARTMAVDEATHRVYTVGAEYEPAPVAAANGQRRRPAMVPGSFTVIVLTPGH